mgnify:CR=1 FL=1
MSKDWVQDIAEMHTKFGVNAVVRDFDREKLKKFLEFRVNFLEEELNETKRAMNEKNPDGVVFWKIWNGWSRCMIRGPPGR